MPGTRCGIAGYRGLETGCVCARSVRMALTMEHGCSAPLSTCGVCDMSKSKRRVVNRTERAAREAAVRPPRVVRHLAHRAERRAVRVLLATGREV